MHAKLRPGGLIIERRPGEEIVITTPDGPVSIAVLDHKGSRVRLQVSAPLKHRVDRREIYDQHNPPSQEPAK